MPFRTTVIFEKRNFTVKQLEYIAAHKNPSHALHECPGQFFQMQHRVKYGKRGHAPVCQLSSND